jgi:AcrR family transcriptional regulator
MLRPTHDELIDGIIDAAAATFARHGLRRTSIQQVADTVGYSKTGLLHHFPTKQALIDAVLAKCAELGDTIATPHLLALPVGRERDLAAIDALITFTLQHPGIAALLSSSLTMNDIDNPALSVVLRDKVTDAFGGFDDTNADTRGITIAVALGGLMTAAVALPADHWNDHTRHTLAATVSRALGH